MRNAAPGFKSELKVNRYPPDPKNDPAAARSPVGPRSKMPRNPPQTTRKLIVTGVII